MKALNELYDKIVEQVEQDLFVDAASSIKELEELVHAFDESELINQQEVLASLISFLAEQSTNLENDKAELANTLIVFNKNRKNINKYYQNK